MGLTPSFWRGRRVLLTGHTGFKGAWLSLWLARLGVPAFEIHVPYAPNKEFAKLDEEGPTVRLYSATAEVEGDPEATKRALDKLKLLVSIDVRYSEVGMPVKGSWR